MTRMNNIFAFLFLAMATAALAGALFAGATWHYYSSGVCLVMAWIFYSENKSLKTKQL
jgi:hypothetical protein